jgi:hypothetical protein
MKIIEAAISSAQKSSFALNITFILCGVDEFM